nr:RNA-directed DNA polymerase, eukaryota, reverse transcriptase zinc-binding domain protein [Tanacetum cinerariifolium]
GDNETLFSGKVKEEYFVTKEDKPYEEDMSDTSKPPGFKIFIKENSECSKSSNASRSDAAIFNDFIQESGLIDLPMGSRSFTWMNKVGYKMSKLDQFLISDNVNHDIPNLQVVALDRRWPDHNPILIHSKKFDFEPRGGFVVVSCLFEQDEHNVSIDSLDMSYDRAYIVQNDDDDDLANEHDLLASLIEKLKCKIDDRKYRNKFLETSNKVLVDKLKEMKKELSAHQETISILSQAKEAQIKLYKTREDKELDKVITLENKVKVLDNIVYKTGQSVQTMNMLNRNCKTSFAKPEFLKKAQRANPRLYD